MPMMVKDMGKEFVEKEMKGAFGIKIIPTEIFIKQSFLRTEKRMILKISFHNLEQSDDNAKLLRK
jgi:transcriptional regulator